MIPGLFTAFFRFVRVLIVIFVIFVPLGIWKAVEIAIWTYRHVSVK